MTTSSPKSYNFWALSGYDMDDMEYVEEFDVPKELAYTPDINDHMLDKVQTENEEGYIAEGYPEYEAKAKARAARMKAASHINELMKINNVK